MRIYISKMNTLGVNVYVVGNHSPLSQYTGDLNTCILCLENAKETYRDNGKCSKTL